jgi:hypothetical protein
MTRWDCAFGSGSNGPIPDDHGLCNRTVVGVVVDGRASLLRRSIAALLFSIKFQLPLLLDSDFCNVDNFGLQYGEILASAMDEDSRKVCRRSTSSKSATARTNRIVVMTTNSLGGSGTANLAFLSLAGLVARPTSLGTAPTNAAIKNVAFQLNTARFIVTLKAGLGRCV